MQRSPGREMGNERERERGGGINSLSMFVYLLINATDVVYNHSGIAVD